MLQEKYNPVDPRSALNSLASFQPLCSGALANRFCQPRGGFRLRRENRDEALSIDIDKGGHKSIKIAHGNTPAPPLGACRMVSLIASGRRLAAAGQTEDAKYNPGRLSCGRSATVLLPGENRRLGHDRNATAPRPNGTSQPPLQASNLHLDRSI